MMITKIRFVVEAWIEHPIELDPVTNDLDCLREAKLVYQNDDLRVKILDSFVTKEDQ